MTAARHPRADEAFPAGLTAREMRVAELIAEGKEDPDIAAELGIARDTAHAHAQSVLVKTGSRNRVGVFRWYLEVTGRPLVGVPPPWPRVPLQRPVPAEEAPCRRATA